MNQLFFRHHPISGWIAKMADACYLSSLNEPLERKVFFFFTGPLPLRWSFFFVVCTQSPTDDIRVVGSTFPWQITGGHHKTKWQPQTTVKQEIWIRGLDLSLCFNDIRWPSARTQTAEIRLIIEFIILGPASSSKKKKKPDAGRTSFSIVLSVFLFFFCPITLSSAPAAALMYEAGRHWLTAEKKNSLFNFLFMSLVKRRRQFAYK